MWFKNIVTRPQEHFIHTELLKTPSETGWRRDTEKLLRQPTSQLPRLKRKQAEPQQSPLRVSMSRAQRTSLDRLRLCSGVGPSEEEPG